MRQPISSIWQLGPALAVLFPLGLWAMLWLSISPGNLAAILNPGSPMAFAQGLRAAFPLTAAGAAAVIIGVKVVQRSHRKFGFSGPLTLATAYGLVGLAASLKSPDGSVALWWAALYLSVPVVLWGIVWGTDTLSQLQRIIDITWLAVVVASLALFIVAAHYLDLVDKILHPDLLLQCEQAQWYDLTGGRLRGTGVGRYAAIAGLIAISGLWQGRWRPIWLVVLLTSLTLLLYTGARGSFAGFAAGAFLILLTYLVYAGKRALLSALLAMLVLVSVLWSTGVHRGFLEMCVFRGPTLSADEQGTAPGTATETNSVAVPGAREALGVATARNSVATLGAREALDVAQGLKVEGSADSLQAATQSAETGSTTKEFFKFTGRTAVWAEGWRLFKDSPLIGFGFHADRLLLNTHMHNALMHALLQAGLFGAIPFVAAVIFAWVLFFRIVRKLTLLPGASKHLVIQCGGVLAFLTLRSFPESTGAFFGVDWLILAPVLFYLQVVNYGRQQLEVDGDRRILERA